MRDAAVRVPWAADLLVFLLPFLCYVWPIELDPGTNVNAHMDHAVAIVAYHTNSIDSFMRPPVGPNTVDWARVPDGRYYSGKAPGCAFAAVPVLAVLHYAESAAGLDPLGAEWFRRNIIIVNWTLNSLGSALALLLLLRIVLAAGAGLGPAVFGVLAVGLGTAFYPYATSYYAHNPAANFIIAAAFVAFVVEPSNAQSAAVGLLAGFAVVFDYIAGFAVLVFGGLLLARRPRAIPWFIAGGLLPLGVLAAYHTAVFGGPATTAYRFLNPKVAPPGGELLRVPSARTMASLTVTPYRGLFVFSPVLLLIFAGVWRAIRMGRHDRAVIEPSDARDRAAIVWAGVVVFVLTFAFNACYYIWWGGWSPGPRYIIPGLVLLAPLVALGFAQFPRLGWILLAISFANQFAIATVSIIVDDKKRNPLLEVIYPQFIGGDFQRANFGTFLLGLKGSWSLLPMLVGIAVIGLGLGRRIPAARSGRPASASGASRPS